MRVLLDEQLPRKLAAEHRTRGEHGSAVRMGWRKERRTARSRGRRGFDVFVTKDQNLEFQQNLPQARMGIIVLDAESHDIDVLRPLVPEALIAIASVRSGEVRHVAL